MSVNMQEPKVGEIVAIYLKWLVTIEVKNNYYFSYQGLENNENNYITLLKYDGDGEFTELYTQSKVYFSSFKDVSDSSDVEKSSDSLDVEKSSDSSDSLDFERQNNFFQKMGKFSRLNWVDFINYYNIFKKSALLIDEFLPIDEEITRTLCEQEENAKEISQHIFGMINTTSMRLEEEMKNILNKDAKCAYGENIVYDFQHGISRKRIIKEEESA